MFQRASDGANMAVARETEMCLFTTHLPASSSTSTSDLSEVEVRYALDHAFDKPDVKVDGSSITVPLQPEVQGLAEADVLMHGSPTTGYDMGSTYNDWFSERFGYAVRLLYIGGNTRMILGNMPPKIAGPQKENGTRGEGSENTFEKLSGSGGGWLGSLTGKVQSMIGGGEKYDGVDQGLSFSDVAPYLVISSKSWGGCAAQTAGGGENGYLEV